MSGAETGAPWVGLVPSVRDCFPYRNHYILDRLPANKGSSRQGVGGVVVRGPIFNSNTVSQGERPAELNWSALVLSPVAVWKLGQPTVGGMRTIRDGVG